MHIIARKGHTYFRLGFSSNVVQVLRISKEKVILLPFCDVVTLLG